MSITCGIDWAEGHHDVALVDDDGIVLVRTRIGVDVDGFTKLTGLIAEHGGNTDDTPVAIETDKNLIVVALSAAGFVVYPINPLAVARYRERYGQAGSKSDPGDAVVLANVLRTDRHVHRRLPANTDHALTIKALARQHQEAVWAMHQTISRLRSVLLEFYPQAVKAFPKLKHHAALTVLAAAPTPAAGMKLTRRRIEALLRKCGRRNDPALVDQILDDLKTPALRQPDRVETALGTTVETLVRIVGLPLVVWRHRLWGDEWAMGSRNYRKFDEDFKQGAVRLVLETGKPIAQVARELGMNEGTLGNWVVKARRERDDGGAAVSESERVELERLRKENVELQMRCDVLKRSVALWVDEAMGR